jgi:hypothetical protein
MKKALQIRLGQPVALGTRSPTQCLNAADFVALDYEAGEVLITCKTGEQYIIPTANVALVKLMPEEAPKKPK